MTWPSDCNMTILAEDHRSMIKVKLAPRKGKKSIKNTMQLTGLANGRILFLCLLNPPQLLTVPKFLLFPKFLPLKEDKEVFHLQRKSPFLCKRKKLQKGK